MAVKSPGGPSDILRFATTRKFVFFFSLRVSLRDAAEPKRDPRWFLSRSRPESSPTTVPFNFPLDASTIRNDFVTRNRAPLRDEKRWVDELGSVVDSNLRNLRSPRHLLNASSDRSVQRLDEITRAARPATRLPVSDSRRAIVVARYATRLHAEPRGMLEETNVSGEVGRKGRSGVDKARKMVSVGESRRKEGKRGEKRGKERNGGGRGEKEGLVFHFFP